jgi:hypothetical protein
MNRAEAKRRKKKAVKEPVPGATVRWTRGLYTGAVHRSAAPAGEEPGFTWGVWLTADVLAAGNSLDAASNAGKKLVDGPADDFVAAVGAANGWIDLQAGKPPPQFPKPPVPTPTPTGGAEEPPAAGDIGWYQRGPFVIVTWSEPEAATPWRWAVYRALQVALYNQDWDRILADDGLVAGRGEADSWFDARKAAESWVDGMLAGEAVRSPADRDEVVAYPPSFHNEYLGTLPEDLLPPVDGLVEVSVSPGNPEICDGILVGPEFWNRAGNVASWLWDNGQHDLRKISAAILDEFTTKCRAADTPAARSFRMELSSHLQELKAYKEQ